MVSHGSYWNATAPRHAFPALTGEVRVDVAVVGGGITGVTTARMLRDRGLTVALVEARRVGEEVTGKSTAKITSQHDISYTTIARKFGEDGARLYAEANETGLATIIGLAERFGIECALERKPAYVWTRDEARVEAIEKEAELTARLGLPAMLTRDIGLPFDVLTALRFDRQAQFHPVRYVKALAATIPGEGSHLFEGARVVDWDPHRVATEAGTIYARRVVMATHLPLGKIGLFFAENFPHVHPVLMGRAEPGRVPPGMYANVEEPHVSVRGHRDEAGADWLIFGGSEFKHGHVDDERKVFEDLERFAFGHFGVKPEWRWTNEDYRPADHAPYVGWSSSIGEGYLVATGFNAWGITNGTAAATLIADLVEEKDSPWLKLFDATRVKPVASAAEFVKGNAEAAAHLIGGYLSRKPKDFAALAPGEAAILKVDGHNLAGFRDEGGMLHACSAVCPHMGCIVGWNETDRTWDCPCHGSRFRPTGEVIGGPAEDPLPPAN